VDREIPPKREVEVPAAMAVAQEQKSPYSLRRACPERESLDAAQLTWRNHRHRKRLAGYPLRFSTPTQIAPRRIPLLRPGLKLVVPSLEITVQRPKD